MKGTDWKGPEGTTTVLSNYRDYYCYYYLIKQVLQRGLKADADLLQQCTHIDAHLKDSPQPWDLRPSNCVGSQAYHRFFWWAQGCETGPTVYHPYLRRLETLTVCRYHYIGNNFSSGHLIETFSGAMDREWTCGLLLGMRTCWTRARHSNNIKEQISF